MQTGATFCSETDVTWQGEVLSVHLADDGGARMSSPTMIKAIAGRGVQGDRYCLGRESGHFSHHKGARRQITLFESEVLDAALRDHNLTLAADECRMNVVTRGVPLNHLVGLRFRVGDVVLRGMKLNEPCSRLEEVVGKRVVSVLVHRCGLFAEILLGGTIRPGDLARSLEG